MQDFAVHRDLLDGLARLVKNGAARRFVDAAALDADKPVLDQVRAADAVFAAEAVQRFHDLQRVHLLPVHGDGIALFEINGDIFRLVRSVFGCDGQLEHALGRLVPRILQDAALEGNVQEVAVHRIRFLGRDIDVDSVLGAVVHHRLPARELLAEPRLAPRGDDLDVRLERVRGELETDLVVALAGRAVADCVRLVGARDFHHALGDQRAGDGCAEQVTGFVDRAGPEHGENEIARELLAQVVDVDLARARLDGLLAQAAELFFLADVRREGDDFGVISFLQPLEND